MKAWLAYFRRIAPKLVATAMYLEGSQKNNATLIISTYRPSNTENFLKMGPLHSEILVSEAPQKREEKTAAEHTARAAGWQAGRAK